MNKLTKMLKNEKIAYIFFGGLTTLISIGSFEIIYAFTKKFNFSNILSIIIGILFAYVVNSQYVFKAAKKQSFKAKLTEFMTFIYSRIATLLLEILLAAIIVFWLSPRITKIITTIVVIIINYVLMKYFVFRKTNVN